MADKCFKISLVDYCGICSKKMFLLVLLQAMEILDSFVIWFSQNDNAVNGNMLIIMGFVGWLFPLMWFQYLKWMQLILRDFWFTTLSMAFAKTPKWLKLAVKSANFKIGLKISNLKNIAKLQNLQFQLNVTFMPDLWTARNQTWIFGITSNQLDQ